MDETPKHTPGPWSYAISGEERIPGYPPMTIYKADKTDLISQNEHGYYDYVAISEADARLIAAAPQMLEAAKLLLTNWPENRDGMDFEQLPVGVKLLRAALAKAEGGKQ
jgi:hypothetical protein